MRLAFYMFALILLLGTISCNAPIMLGDGTAPAERIAQTIYEGELIMIKYGVSKDFISTKLFFADGRETPYINGVYNLELGKWYRLTIDDGNWFVKSHIEKIETLGGEK